jgi:hypothetical protein
VNRWEVAIAPILGRVVREVETGDAVVYSLGGDEGLRFADEHARRLIETAPLLRDLMLICPPPLAATDERWWRRVQEVLRYVDEGGRVVEPCGVESPKIG